MEYIFHETQEGLLCAQHCLNSLLQGDYYSAPDLANIAMELDAMEQTIQNPSSSHESSNYDDTGYFSIQVIQTALKQWNLDLIPFKSQNDMAKLARENPTQMQAYICNFKQHWYTIRKLGKYWFNLNSMLSKPELISDTYLAVLLKQLETDGYSIFIVDGELPKCDAERNLSIIELDTREILNRQVQGRARTSRTLDNEGFDDKELKRAIKMSLIENDRGLDADANSKLFPDLVYAAHDEDDDDDDEGQLREAIKMSLEGNQKEAAQATTSKEETPVSDSASAEISAEEIRRKRLKYLDNLSKSQPDTQ